MAPAARPPATGVAVLAMFLAQVGADYADGTWSPLPIPLLGWLLVWSVGERVREHGEREAASRAELEREAPRGARAGARPRGRPRAHPHRPRPARLRRPCDQRDPRAGRRGAPAQR